MKILVLKYRDIIGRIILGSYLLIFALSIFHFHKYNLNRISAIEIESESNLQIKISSSEFACIIHQNFNSLHTLAIPNSFVTIPIDLTKQDRLIGIFRSDIKPITLSTNHLRAPPFFS
jgi:hypothetical protein